VGIIFPDPAIEAISQIIVLYWLFLSIGTLLIARSFRGQRFHYKPLQVEF
jgi:hypothetical protein